MYLLNLKNVRCFGVNISLKLILPIFFKCGNWNTWNQIFSLHILLLNIAEEKIELSFHKILSQINIHGHLYITPA